MIYDLKEIDKCIYFVNNESVWTIGTINDIKITTNGVIYHIAYDTDDGLAFINLKESEIFDSITDFDTTGFKFFIIPGTYKDTRKYNVYKISEAKISILRLEGDVSCIDLYGEHIGTIESKYFMDNNFDIVDKDTKISKRMLEFNNNILKYKKFIVPSIGVNTSHRIRYDSMFDDIILAVEPNINKSFVNISMSVKRNADKNKTLLNDVIIRKSQFGNYAIADDGYLVLIDGEKIPDTINIFGVEWEYVLKRLDKQFSFLNTKIFPNYVFYKITKLSISSENVMQIIAPKIRSYIHESTRQEKPFIDEQTFAHMRLEK